MKYLSHLNTVRGSEKNTSWTRENLIERGYKKSGIQPKKKGGRSQLEFFGTIAPLLTIVSLSKII